MNPSPFTNRLQHESSLYLRQHAHNPVDWYAWGPEALERAKREKKPIFLSIGYSACHWCHVMAHESFEDEATASLMNEHFINIKVDREERPDLDQIYMNAVTALTGHGGWPMSVFLTPDLKPFYGGTYYPPVDRYGMPSFKTILNSVAQAWEQRQEEIANSAGQITAHLQAAGRVEPGEGELTQSLLENAVRGLGRAFDSTYGGFGQAPKFPHALELKLLLRAWKRFDDDEALRMARLTLDRMAMGGMVDQLGGGFHRYSTDARWLVPHFEKMLYDNALLSSAYLEAFLATGDAGYREVVEETLQWVQRDMTSPKGAFYSTLDADSEGVEGKFYVWTVQEIETILGKDLAEVFAYVYDVSTGGNWEGHSILNRTKTYVQCAKLLNTSEAELRSKLTAAKQKLLAVRSRRVWPGRDEKILTSWNALMIAAFAQAAQVFGGNYLETATKAADFILNNMRQSDGRLFHTCDDAGGAKLNGYLEDYAFLIDALVTLYETNFEARWLQATLSLADVMVEQFADEKEGGFFFTGRDHESLVVRNKDTQDGSTPSGNSMAVIGLLRLAKLTGRRDLEDKAVRTLQLFSNHLSQAPMGVAQMLVGLDFFLGPVEEFAVIANQASEKLKEAVKAIQAGFRPNKVVAAARIEAKPATETIPLLKERTAPASEVAVYVCRNYECQAPIVGVESLRKTLS